MKHEERDWADGFAAGIVYAAQQIASTADQPTLAVEILKESGLSRKELSETQRKSGYESRLMMPLIRKATDE